jgi:hypothetical protein
MGIGCVVDGSQLNFAGCYFNQAGNTNEFLNVDVADGYVTVDVEMGGDGPANVCSHWRDATGDLAIRCDVLPGDPSLCSPIGYPGFANCAIDRVNHCWQGSWRWEG